MLKLVEFIHSHDNWEELLSNDPYNIKISKDSLYGHDLMLFKYNQLSSDFNNDIVRECRGLILDENTLEPVCVPFFKFGNYGESYCPNIDWKSAKITQKIDGSLIKIVRLGNDLLISTNGSIDASKALVTQAFECEYDSYRDLVEHAEPLVSIDKNDWLNLFEENYTYMFELTSPYNKVVIPYSGIKLTLIGVRDNISLKEISIYEHELSKVFDVPNRYSFASLNDCIKSAQLLPYDEEGYVVVDGNFNRVKVKSTAYVAVHHLKGEGILTPRKALELLRANEISEFLNYFSEYRVNFENLGKRYEQLIQTIQQEWLDNQDNIERLDSRKDKALYIQNHCHYQPFMFGMISNKFCNSKQYIDSLVTDKLLQLLEDLNG